MFYYDTTALGSNYAVNEQDFHWNVVHEFELRGWRVESVYLGNPMHHHEKYLLINNAFAGKQRLMPFFNRSNNVIAKRFRSIAEKEHCSNTAPTAPTRFLPFSRSYFVVDTLFIGCEKFPYRDNFSVSMSGVM